MNEWIYIDDYNNILPKETLNIHCDTRDFHIICTKDDISLDKFKNFSKECIFNCDEILPILKDIEIRSGGKGRWRAINTEHHPGWLKYIRFIKNSDDTFIAYSSLGDRFYPITREILTEPLKSDAFH